jgi:hypothetical protein
MNLRTINIKPITIKTVNLRTVNTRTMNTRAALGAAFRQLGTGTSASGV